MSVSFPGHLRVVVGSARGLGGFGFAAVLFGEFFYWGSVKKKNRVPDELNRRVLLVVYPTNKVDASRRAEKCRSLRVRVPVEVCESGCA